MIECWAGQYFVEMEYLLFNKKHSSKHILDIVKAWAVEFRPSLMRRVTVQGYLYVAILSKDSIYILLRIARRVAMALLPATFFPRSCSFQQERISSSVIKDIGERLEGY